MENATQDSKLDTDLELSKAGETIYNKEEVTQDDIIDLKEQTK